MLKRAGIKKKHLHQKETALMILDIISQGIESSNLLTEFIGEEEENNK